MLNSRSFFRYTKATPSISYSQNPTPKDRKRFNFDVQKSREPNKIRRDRSRSNEKFFKHDRKSEKKESPSKKSRGGNSSPTKQKIREVNEIEKLVEFKIDENEKKTESLVSDIQTNEIDGTSRDPLIPLEDVVDTGDLVSDEIQSKEDSPDPESLSKEIDSIFETSKFPKIEIKIERKKSPRRLEKPKVNIFLEDSDEVDEFENTTFEVKSRWTTPPRLKTESTVEEIVVKNEKSVPLMDLSQTVETKKLNHLEMPVVIESPERSPILTSDDIFTIAKSPSPPPKPNANVRNVCSFLSDIASGNFLSNFLNDDKDKTGGLSSSSYTKSDVKIVDSQVEPDTTVSKANENSDDDDSDATSSDSDSDSDDSSSSSSSSDTTTSESEEEIEESSDEEGGLQTSFSGFGTFSSSSMPMVQQIRPLSTPSTPASISLINSSHVPTAVAAPIRPGVLTVLNKTNLYTPPPMKTLSTTPATPFSFPAVGGLPGIPAIPFKIYSLRDVAIFTPPMTPPSTVSTPISTHSNDRMDKRTSDRASEKRDRDRERKRSRTRSLSRERDRKRAKDDRRKSPNNRRKSPSPIRKRQIDEKRDLRRRDDERRRDTHNRPSSPIRKRKSRSKSPTKNRSPIRRSKSPTRPRTPPPAKRRSSPHRRSISRSPPSKHRRSVSPGVKRARSPSPNHRRSPRRSRHSRSPNRRRRTPSPNHRYDRRSYSPAFRGKMESPSVYKPDSTISDTELERQQQMHNDDFYGQWSNQNSPKRANLEDRISNTITDSPTYLQQQEQMRQQQYLGYPCNEFAYDNQQMLQNDMYGMYDEYGNYVSSRNYVNNSNLVEITQQKREKQRVESSQVAVQVGNVLQIVPTKAVPPQVEIEKQKSISAAEKRAQSKARRKIARERKRQEKASKKEKLRQDIQKFFDAGITADHSDNEELVPLRNVNITAIADKGILKKIKTEGRNERRVLFKDGILPGESTSDEGDLENDTIRITKKVKLEKFRKKRLSRHVKGQHFNGKQESNEIFNEIDSEKLPPPNAPIDSPQPNLLQPRLKKITPEMFAAFPVDPSPMYYYIEQLKVQMAQSNGYHHQQQQQPSKNLPRGQNERFSYYKKFEPPPIHNQQQHNIGQFQNHSQQQHYNHHHHHQYNNQRSNMMPPTRSSQNNSSKSTLHCFFLVFNLHIIFFTPK